MLIGPQKITEGQRDDFARHYEAGMSTRLLAKRYNCCVDTVRHRAKEWGLKRPNTYVAPRGGPAKELHPSTLRERWARMLPEMIAAVKKAAMS